MRLLAPSLLLLLVLLTSIATPPAAAYNLAALPLLGKSIVIDPGHGGIDPGACGHGQAEEQIVLELAFQLRDVLVAAGAEVRLTREADVDLSNLISAEQVRSRKRRDIMGRVKLVNQWQPDILLSLHVNAVPSSRWRGAQVFYQEHSEQSLILSRALQQAITDVLQNTNRQPKPGDYRILNDSEPTSALLEIGFISNPAEARLMANPHYRHRIAWAIFTGLVRYWSTLPTE